MTATNLFYVLGLSGMSLLSVFAQAQNANKNAEAELVQVTDLKAMSIVTQYEDKPIALGLGSIITQSQLASEAVGDIHQIITFIPGTYVREDDGFGLRPNIGIRGAAASGSQNITLLEDGILLAPAPYANPVASYFPTQLRTQQIEVLKSASSLRYGPQTAGVINLVSTPIPKASGGSLLFTVNDRGSYDAWINYGGTDGAWSAVVETVQRRAQGFKDIDRSKDDSGFELEDYLFKIKWEEDKNSLFFKVQSSDENANSSSLGLSDNDFNRDTNRRYGLSSIDEITTKNLAMLFSHEYRWTDEVTATFNFYRNEFSRNGLQFTDNNSLINAANGLGGSVFNRQQAQNILHGINEPALAGQSLSYIDNNRDAVSQGQELNFHFQADGHNLQFGLRNHRDRERRFDATEQYSQANGSLQYQSRLAATGSNNSIARARAFSAWLSETYEYHDKLDINFSLRYENIETQRTQYSNGNRSAVSDKRHNDKKQWLAGLSFHYHIDDQWQTSLSYHQGYSPIGASANSSQKSENSDNYELGLRYQLQGLLFEFVAFHSIFDNKIENCSVEFPCSNGANDNSFNVGEADVSGLEVQINNVFNVYGFSLPIRASYTYTQAETKERNDELGLSSGQQLKDIPEQIYSLRTGIVFGKGWNNYVILKYIDETCVTLGCNNNNNAFNKTQDLTVTDWLSQYTFSDKVNVFLKVENIFDKQKIISRSPAGAKTNQPRTFTAGVKYTF